jgi:hypothetical protein
MSKPSEYDEYCEHLLREEENYNQTIRQYYAHEKSAGLKVPGWAFLLAGAGLTLVVGYAVLVWMRLL